LKWLYEQCGLAHEILPNGEVITTAIAQKSGRFLTASDNTLAHIYILAVHYVRMCDKFGMEPTFKQMMHIFTNFVYSDDLMGATDYPEFVQEADLKETFALFGMGVKDYKLSTDPLSIHFLGADNVNHEGTWVPKYDEERMYFALAYTGGRLSDAERTQRISGLAHNLAFSPKYASVVCRLSQQLHNDGRWIDSPLLDEGHLKIVYTAAGVGQSKGSLCLHNGGEASAEST
jgi:hypothetical protein